jgi:hypothetical protein
MGDNDASDSQEHPDDTDWVSLESNLVYTLYEGAPHTLLNQMEVCSYGFPLLFAYEFPSENGSKVQRNSLMRTRYPLEDGDDDDDDDVTGIVFALTFALSVVSLLLAATCIYTCMQRSHMTALQKRVEMATAPLI